MTAPGEFERLIRIETKLDELIKTTSERGIDHESRLRALEQFKWISVGIAAAAGGAAGTLAGFFGLS
ncbi:MAG: hypothetical protein LLG14_20445 [Nocardiaceae bacterium]|nr:hypothetical protein [Nocardiaceae bacterium]